MSLYDYRSMLDDLNKQVLFEIHDSVDLNTMDFIRVCYNSLETKRSLSRKQEDYILKLFNIHCIPKK